MSGKEHSKTDFIRNENEKMCLLIVCCLQLSQNYVFSSISNDTQYKQSANVRFRVDLNIIFPTQQVDETVLTVKFERNKFSCAIWINEWFVI